jgi:RsiW-degrading membrane proteinase PrsW (M82 family)
LLSLRTMDGMCLTLGLKRSKIHAGKLIRIEYNRCVRTMPLAVLIGMFIVTGIYFLINCAYFMVLDTSQILESDAIANVSHF